jgi:hypothetical protein
LFFKKFPSKCLSAAYFATKIFDLMSDFFTLQDAGLLARGFEDCTLPEEDFTHEAHLIAGFYVLSQFGDNAMPAMRERIRRFNESKGKQNTDSAGYHETITFFWLWAIRQALADANGNIRWNDENLDDLLFDEQLADRNLWLRHYSKERMMSKEARLSFVEPDLEPFL